jgi:glycosyltransferase involved in cell wall biosynthesis
MLLLILSPRFPEYGYKGDQLRARQLIDLLAPEHDLHVITAGNPSGADALRELRERARVTLVHAGLVARAVSALTLLTRGYPVQVGWMSPGPMRWRARAEAGNHDAVIAITARALSDPLPAPTVLDHIDALSVNMLERARVEHRFPLRLAESVEAKLLARHERRSSRWVRAQLTVSPRDQAALPPEPAPIVIPQAVFERIDATDPGEPRVGRDIDLIFTGNMRYPPNRAAAEWLCAEIVPELQRVRPDTRTVVAGRFADRLRLDGVEVASDVDDITALLRRARVAIAPLRSGTGVPNKMLEAAAAGAAIVATPRAAEAAGVAALTADDPPTLAAAVAKLLASEEDRTTLVARALADLETRAPQVVAAQLQAMLARVVAIRAPEGPKMEPPEESP